MDKENTHQPEDTKTHKSSINTFKIQTDINFPTEEIQNLLVIFATVRFTKRVTLFTLRAPS